MYTLVTDPPGPGVADQETLGLGVKAFGFKQQKQAVGKGKNVFIEQTLSFIFDSKDWK